MSRQVSGLKAWTMQRATALYLAIFFVYLMAKLAFSSASENYAAWRAWLGDPVVSVAALIFFAALLVHAWIGVRNILIDCVRQIATRILALWLVGLVLIGNGFWVFQVVINSRID